MSEELGIKGATEFWVFFKGIQPTLVTTSVIQSLVNSRGDDVLIMDKEKTKSWTPATEMGFQPSRTSVVSKLIQRASEEEAEAEEEELSEYLSQDESVNVVTNMDESDYIKVFNNKRKVALTGKTALSLVLYKGAVVVRGSLIKNNVRSDTKSFGKKKIVGKGLAR